MDHADYPALYQVADSTSIQGQRAYRRLIRTELVLVVVGAVLAAIGAMIGELEPADIGSHLRPLLLLGVSAPFLGAMIAKSVNRGRGYDHDWFDGRAIAETVKTQTWRFMLRVPPFHDDSAERLFSAELRSVLHARELSRQTLALLPEQPQQITNRMREVRALPFAQRRSFYVTERLADQANWYRAKARWNQDQASRWFWFSLSAEFAAVLLALTGVFYPAVADLNLFGVLASIAAALTGWNQLGRHDDLSKSYALAYQELLVIQTLTEAADTEERLLELVRDGEAAISREHTMWIAKRGDPIAVTAE